MWGFNLRIGSCHISALSLLDALHTDCNPTSSLAISCLAVSLMTVCPLSLCSSHSDLAVAQPTQLTPTLHATFLLWSTLPPDFPCFPPPFIQGSAHMPLPFHQRSSYAPMSQTHPINLSPPYQLTLSKIIWHIYFPSYQLTLSEIIWHIVSLFSASSLECNFLEGGDLSCSLINGSVPYMVSGT